MLSDLPVHLDPAAVPEVDRGAAVRLVTLFPSAFVLVSPDYEEEGRGQRREDEEHGEQDDERRGERRLRVVFRADHGQGPLFELFQVGDGERPCLALHDDVAGRLQVDLDVVRECFAVVADEAEVLDDGGFGCAWEGHLSEDAVAAVSPPGEGDGVVASVHTQIEISRHWTLRDDLNAFVVKVSPGVDRPFDFYSCPIICG